MAVFYDNGGGDIYAGPNKKAIIAAMKNDIGNSDFDESMIYKVSGDIEIPVMVTISDQYEPDKGSYCIASDNC